MSIVDVVSSRNITQVIHFTTNRGLVGTLATGLLLSRARLRKDELLAEVAYPNTKFRQEELSYFDKEQNWIDFVNLSVSEPNHAFFNVSRRWHMEAYIYWVVLAFDPEVLGHEGVVFTTTNNVYGGCHRNAGSDGLDALFASKVHRKDAWWAHRAGQPENVPTCEQAEVLYPGELDAKYLRRVYVATQDELIRTKASLAEFDRRDVEVVLDPYRCGKR